MREKISACVICYNEEQKIARCLRSLTWCDEIVVLDSYSTDRTVEICRKFTDRVHQHEWLGYVGQRNLVRDLSSNAWVLFLDSDEEVSAALRGEILGELDRGASDYVGYEFPRQVHYLGKWIRHGEWYPDVKLRLFKKAYGRTEGMEPHDKVAVNGRVKRLRNPLWHYTYDSVSDHMDTLNRFSSITARQRFVQGERLRWTDLMFRPGLRFLKGYFIKRGFMDGAHGLIVAVLSAYGSFAKYAKIWELQVRSGRSFKEMPDAASGRD